MELYLGGIEGVEGGITDEAGSWPLRVEGGLGPCVEAVALGGSEVGLDVANGGNCDCAVAGDPGRATALGWICEIYCVALIEEVGGPARAIIWCVEEILGFGVRIKS